MSLIKKEVKVEKTKAIQSKSAIEVYADTDGFSWTKSLWIPLQEMLIAKSDIKGSKPADKDYTHYKIKSVDAHILLWYKEKTGEAGVALKTYGGEVCRQL